MIALDTRSARALERQPAETYGYTAYATRKGADGAGLPYLPRTNDMTPKMQAQIAAEAAEHDAMVDATRQRFGLAPLVRATAVAEGPKASRPVPAPGRVLTKPEGHHRASESVVADELRAELLQYSSSRGFRLSLRSLAQVSDFVMNSVYHNIRVKPKTEARIRAALNLIKAEGYTYRGERRWLPGHGKAAA